MKRISHHRMAGYAVAIGCLQLAASCDDSVQCLDVTVVSVLRLRLQQADWSPGNYRIEAQDRERGKPTGDLSCEVKLPEGKGVTCSEGKWPASSSQMRLSVGWTADSYLPTSMNDLELRVMRNDALIFEDRIRPQYTLSEPYGPGCGITRSATLIVPMD